jgi:pSer/pThr/pTyr-binding forkhead associated (FHA) protein
MYKINCPNCKNEVFFQSADQVPPECSFCFEVFSENIKTNYIMKTEKEVTGLTITYQKTNEKIFIDTDGKKFLGRNHAGDEVFQKIRYLIDGEIKAVISRPHCSIEYKNGNFYLLDENSTNGTYFGINRLSCTNSPQIIKDNDIFYMGKYEPFVAQINYKEPEKVKKYKCKECGKESDNWVTKCAGCGKKNTQVEIEDPEPPDNTGYDRIMQIISSLRIEDSKKSELRSAVEHLTYDYCIIDTNIWMETHQTIVYHKRIRKLSELYHIINKTIIVHGYTYEELKKHADSKDKKYEQRAAFLAIKMIKDLNGEGLLEFPNLAAVQNIDAYADPEIIKYATAKYQIGKSILVITNDFDCNLRMNASLSRLKMKKHMLVKYEVMNMDKFAKYIDLIHKYLFPGDDSYTGAGSIK